MHQRLCDKCKKPTGQKWYAIIEHLPKTDKYHYPTKHTLDLCEECMKEIIK